MRNLFIIIISCICINAFSQETITAAQSKDFVGKEVVVVGKVAGSKLFQRQTGNLLLLNIDKSHPDNEMTVVIEGEVLAKIKFTEADLQDKLIKIKGVVSIFKEKPQIKLENEANLIIVQ